MTLRAGIIGGGFMGSVHARSIRAARGEVYGVATASPAGGVQAAARLGATRSFGSIDVLLDSPDVDIVHICTPNLTHVDLATRALRAGKNVVCEKPLATTVDDASALASLAHEMGSIAAVPFVYRFHPMVRHAQDRFASGVAGRLFSIQGAYLQDWMASASITDWRVDSAHGGPSRALADIGSHLIDLIEFVTGERLVRVEATLRTVHPIRSGLTVDTEDMAAILVETESGAIGTLMVTQVAAGRKNALTFELSASEETLRFNQEAPEELWVGRTSGSQLLLREPAQLDGDAARLSTAPAGHPLGYLDAFAAFVADVYDAVEGNPHAGTPLFQDGLRAVEITSAILESSRSRAVVEVPTFKEFVTTT